MHRFSNFIVSAALILFMSSRGLAEAPVYQPCPLLRAYHSPPVIDRKSDSIKSFNQEFSALFDRLVHDGGSDDFGEITPNTTSFTVVLFSGSEDTETDPVFFEYHHTAVEALQDSRLGADTVFPLGTLTQLFTVYAWLVEVGDEHWGTSVTVFLPELNNASTSGLAVNWDEITIGALAGQMSGLARDSYACTLNKPCNRTQFLEEFSTVPPLFRPDTTPLISNAGFQLLALALEARTSNDITSTFDHVLYSSVFEPLNMTKSRLLSSTDDTDIYAHDLNASAVGDPAALAMLSTASDLARAGHAMLSSKLISKGSTRRWLQPVADTSNLRNGVGRPWEIYHAGQYANSSILDVSTKTGLIGHYASYFGLAPDFNAGFAILAHDTEATHGPDLNVYADIVSLAILKLQKLAAAEMAARYAGFFEGPSGSAIFNTSSDGHGLVVSLLKNRNIDLRQQVAAAAGIELANLDFRLYPSNVATDTQHQFVAVFQDKSAPVDMGTPTCITWQDVDSLGSSINVRFVFGMDESGRASDVTLGDGSLVLSRSD